MSLFRNFLPRVWVGERVASTVAEELKAMPLCKNVGVPVSDDRFVVAKNVDEAVEHFNSEELDELFTLLMRYINSRTQEMGGGME